MRTYTLKAVEIQRNKGIKWQDYWTESQKT